MRFSRSPILFALLAVWLGGCRKQKPPPSIDALSAALERTASQTLTAPPLANERVTLTVKPEQIDARVVEVFKAASAAGGAAIRSVNAQGQVLILATIPENNADAFEAAIRTESSAMAKPTLSSRLIEVLMVFPTPSPHP